MSRCMMLSDKPPENYEKFLMEASEFLHGMPVMGLALVTLMEDGTAVTGYHELDVLGKQIAAAQIQADITDAIVRANIADYIAELEEPEEDEECEEE